MPEPTAATTPARDDTYDALLAGVRRRFAALTTGERPVHLFTTDTPPLDPIFLEALPAELRQEHTCSACRRFMDRFGGLVLVGPGGQTVPALWDPAAAPEPYVAAVRSLAEVISQAPISGVFLAHERVWGQPETGAWSHLAVTPDAALVHRPGPLQTTGQVRAEKRHDHEVLLRGLAEFSYAHAERAHTMLTSEQLFRAEKCLGVAKWLLDLHQSLRATKDARARDNLVWLAVAGAPAGFCHLRSSMIGTLLADIQQDLPFAEIKARFAAKLHPLQYQRPTAPPSAGNIAQAEKIVAQLKAAGALERRFARLDDLQTLWRPATSGRAGVPGGVFAGVKPGKQGKKEAPKTTLPTTKMTWQKFARTVLPTAEHIEFMVPAGKRIYLAFVTAKHADAAPILQWDQPERRNPATCYVYIDGSTPQRWGLVPDVYHPVTAVALHPAHWDASKNFSHIGETATFVLAGAKDREYVKGAGLFPEWLKSEFHPIRATIEAYTREAVIADKDAAGACGISLSKGGAWNHEFRVTTRGGVQAVYRLDRWD